MDFTKHNNRRAFWLFSALTWEADYNHYDHGYGYKYYDHKPEDFPPTPYASPSEIGDGATLDFTRNGMRFALQVWIFTSPGKKICGNTWVMYRFHKITGDGRRELFTHGDDYGRIRGTFKHLLGILDTNIND